MKNTGCPVLTAPQLDDRRMLIAVRSSSAASLSIVASVIRDATPIHLPRVKRRLRRAWP
jgi:hypothetical protein